MEFVEGAELIISRLKSQEYYDNMNNNRLQEKCISDIL
jgi:hypothetical protein